MLAKQRLLIMTGRAAVGQVGELPLGQAVPGRAALPSSQTALIPFGCGLLSGPGSMQYFCAAPAGEEGVCG